MTFMNLSYYLNDAKVTIKCDHVPLHEFLTAHILKSKQSGNWKCKHKLCQFQTYQRPRQHISKQYLTCKVHSLIWFPGREGERVWTWYFQRTSPYTQTLPVHEKKEQKGEEFENCEKSPPTHGKVLAQIEQNDTVIHEIQHVPLKFDLDEIRRS